MSVNIESIVRSGVALIVILPVTLAMGSQIRSTTELAETKAAEVDEYQEKVAAVKTELLEPCLSYVLSKNDSKLEREAMTAVDEALGGDANYKETCRWALS